MGPYGQYGAAPFYFRVTAPDIYAQAHCRGDQPRYVARAEYGFSFWIRLLSTEPIEKRSRHKWVFPSASQVVRY